MKMRKVILIEDNDIIRESYKEIIDATENYHVIGDFETCEEALEFIDIKIPDIIFIDITLPGMDGIEGIKRIKSKHKDVKIIVVTVHENSTYVFNALREGAVGYLTKNSGKIKILEALSQLELGGAPMSTQIARMVVESFVPCDKNFEILTDRENEVLQLLAEGKSYANIANDLFISVNTVKKHLRNVYEKLHVKDKYEAIKLVRNKK